MATFIISHHKKLKVSIFFNGVTKFIKECFINIIHSIDHNKNNNQIYSRLGWCAYLGGSNNEKETYN